MSVSHGNRDALQFHQLRDEVPCPACSNYLSRLATEGWASPQLAMTVTAENRLQDTLREQIYGIE